MIDAMTVSGSQSHNMLCDKLFSQLDTLRCVTFRYQFVSQKQFNGVFLMLALDDLFN